MISKELVFNSLIFLAIISFGIFGSLSHIFNFIIIVLATFHLLIDQTTHRPRNASKKLFFALSFIFFVFVFRGFFHHDKWSSIQSLSPMLPLPIIASMVLLINNERLHVKAKHLSIFSKVSVISAFLLYILFYYVLKEWNFFGEAFYGRLEIFSGNPIPFSTAIYGVTIFCLSNWNESSKSEKIITLACCFIGFWLAGISSGTRGALLVICISMPFFLFFITKSYLLTALIFFLGGLIGWLVYFFQPITMDDQYLNRLLNGFDSIFSENKKDGSMTLRWEIWSASINTIKENPFFGYDVSNRFTALKINLVETTKKTFTHPHNDILASVIGAGIIGGLMSIISLLSPIWASILSNKKNETKFLLGVLVTLSIVVTANTNTIFFNDITSAWLAFSTFLIWNLKFDQECDSNKKVT